MSREDDRSAIAELLYTYAWHFDRNEPDAVAGLFTSDASINYGPEMDSINGRDEILRVIKPGLEKLFAATSHHISNVRVRFAGDGRADCDAYVYAWHKYHSGVPDGHLWGQYHCTFRLEDGRWLISSLKLLVAGLEDFHRDEMNPIGRKP